MIKYICDCCGKESDGINKMSVNETGRKVEFGVTIDKVFAEKLDTIFDKELCRNCLKEIQDYSIAIFNRIYQANKKQ